MENAIIMLLVLVIAVSGVLMLVGGSLNSTDVLSQSWKEAAAISGDMERTSINAISYAPASGNRLEVTLQNDGNVSLHDFEGWDVTVDYYNNTGDYQIARLSYYEAYPPGGNQWSVEGTYFTAKSEAEVFQPSIFDPGEEMVVSLKMNPTPGSGEEGVAVIGTENGVTTSISWLWP